MRCSCRPLIGFTLARVFSLRSSGKPFNEVIQQLTTSLEDVGDKDWERNASEPAKKTKLRDMIANAKRKNHTVL